MTRVVTFAFVLLIAIPAAAQEMRLDPRVPTGAASAQDAVASASGVVLAAGGDPQPGAPPPSRNADTPRRRGSMVGYLEDPIVSSKVRVRFDLGFHDQTPDLAEFFYAKCGCYRDLKTTDPQYDPNAPGPRPGAANDVNFRQLYVLAEYAPSQHFSAFVELPTRWLLPQTFIPNTGGTFSNQTGLGDLRAGAKLALSSTSKQALTAQVKLFFPTGDASKGLGTDHASIEPAFLFYGQVHPRVAIEGQVGALLPFDGSAGLPTSSSDKFSGRIFSYGVGPSVEVYRSRQLRVAPVVELIGWHVLDGFATGLGDASSTNIVNVKIGARATWSNGSSVYFGYGHALTDADWYEDIMRFEYRLGF